MPYQESFKNLIEIQSIQNKILEYQKVIKGEEERIDHITDERKDKDEQLSSFKEEIESLELNILKKEESLEKLDNSLSTAKNHLKNASSEKEVNALESEILTWEGEKSLLEDELINDFEEQEIKKEQISTFTSFLTGSETTLNELTIEVKNQVHIENEKITDLKNRIKNLIDSCEAPVKRSFLEANSRHEFNSPLALIDENRCNKCQMHLPTNLSQLIESEKVLDYCPNCGRLLIPHSSLT